MVWHQTNLAGTGFCKKNKTITPVQNASGLWFTLSLSLYALNPWLFTVVRAEIRL